jgi:hypothetical protein
MTENVVELGLITVVVDVADVADVYDPRRE